jgi:dolichol-phosphate mannosyltransferase
MTPCQSTPQVVLPAHNEADTIEAVLTEFHRVAAESGIAVSFVVSEDGSTDDTADIVRLLAARLPIELVSEPRRKGYSRAVVDGLLATTSELVVVADSDGQCDPHDLPALIGALDDATDIVIGFRHDRADSAVRKAMSAAFRLAYRLVFPVRLRDPSCPYMVMRRSALLAALQGRPGILRQGFWWEFNARAAAAGLRTREVPIAHRSRLAGTTQVYRPTKVPRIAWEHLRGLFELRRDIARARHC